MVWSGMLLNWRIWMLGAGFLTVGIILGAYLNKWGYIMENIKVEISVSDLHNSYEYMHKDRSGSLNNSKPIVPNIVHFIWFGSNKKMKFLNYVSVYSAFIKQKPDRILFHCDHLPVGMWWERLYRDVPLQIVHRDPPKTVFDQTLAHIYHKGDIAKLEILMTYGGIYLDTDVLVLRQMDQLRKHPLTLGREIPPKFIAGIIVAHKDALFLKLWYKSYKRNYRMFDWDFNCARVPYQIYLQKPDLVHVERRRLTTPDWRQRHLLWTEVIDWNDLYVVHVMAHLDFLLDFEFTPESIKSLNSTFGETMRYIYYGSPERL